ncbi:MAG: hypothetical protein KA146_01940 [Leptospiraceae bacterium]|nr:hypothetical protein [Leptospiraceae bacterium]
MNRENNKGLQMYYPKDWEKFTKAIKKKKAIEILNRKNEDEKELLKKVNRFAARYRLAKSFDGVILNRYNEDTVKTYSSIIKVFLSFTAFEIFLQIIPKNEEILLKESFNDTELKKISNSIIKLNKDKNILSSIKEKLPFKPKDLGNKDKLELFLSKKENYYTKIFVVAEIIRHKFAHGILTANLNNSESKSTIKICEIITERILFKVMDDQFTKLNY